MFRNLSRTLIASAALFLAMILSGCAGNPPGVPASAVHHATGAHPAWTTAHAGTAYVFDATDHRLIYQAHLNVDQDVSVDPIANQITVDGVPVQVNTLRRDHSYQIYFNRS